MDRNQTNRFGGNAEGIVAALMADHRKVEQLFAAIEACNEDENQHAAELGLELKKELMVHSNVEDRVVYMFLEQHSGFEDKIEHAREEHADIEELLLSLDHLEPGGKKWRKTIGELKEAVQHHVQEEEGKILPSAQSILRGATSEELAERFAAEKESELQELLETEPSLGAHNGEELRAH